MFRLRISGSPVHDSPANLGVPPNVGTIPRPRITISTAHLTIFVSSLLRLFFVASFLKIIYTKRAGRARVFGTDTPLTTNHLPKKGDLWLTPILSAHQKTLAVRKKTTLTFTIFFTSSMKLSCASAAHGIIRASRHFRS